MRTYQLHPVRFVPCDCDRSHFTAPHRDHVEIVSTRSKKIMGWGVYYRINEEETWIADCGDKKAAERVRGALTLY